MMTKKTRKSQESCSKNTPPTPAPPSGTQMIVPISIATYPSFPERGFLKNMSERKTTTKRTIKLNKEHSKKYTTTNTTPSPGRHMIFPRVIRTYQYLSDLSKYSE